jgi:hypothetical protein
VQHGGQRRPVDAPQKRHAARKSPRRARLRHRLRGYKFLKRNIFNGRRQAVAHAAVAACQVRQKVVPMTGNVRVITFKV